MLRELDFIEGDWSALLWALGSATVILRYSVPSGLRAWFKKRFVKNGEPILKNLGKSAGGMASGMGIAVGVLAACAFGLVRLSFLLLPGWEVERLPWAQWVTVIVIPETIFIVAALALWRKRRSMATGIVLSGIALITHFIIHLANRG